jgi:hypothetical protein
MEDYLIKLNLERDYDSMMRLMLIKENVEEIKNFFEGLNTKVLLSSFLIKNFYDYFLLDKNDNLVKSSINISQHLLEKNLEKVGEEYRNFYTLFVNWRNEDIDGMKSEINSAKTQLETMVTEEPQDDADEQWNTGVKISMEIMDNTVKMLDTYGKSPPAL